MPSKTWTKSIAAGETFEPLNGWQYEYAPAPGAITILHNAGAVDVVVTITSGAETLQERSPVSASGTTGHIPSQLDEFPVTDLVMGGDRMKILYENTSAGAIVVNGIIDYQPA